MAALALGARAPACAARAPARATAPLPARLAAPCARTAGWSSWQCARGSGGAGSSARRASVLVRAASAEGMAPQLKTAIDSLISSNKIVVFMKGTKQFPQCGFSNTVVQILRNLDAEFETVNILENDALRSGMKEYSQWPTFPQVYLDGEFYGGCDIMIEAYQSGELMETLERLKLE
ncbi:GRXS7 [Scenedesmus sp. PABB004]|nr:GRXS7 [Scenedesmus sp. PABB004]